MALHLPASDSPIRELFDVADLVTMSTKRSFPTFREAQFAAWDFLITARGAKSVNAICVRANGAVWLVTFTRRDFKRVWDFGNPINRTRREIS